MNGGEGETSYAANSLIQKEGMSKAKPVLEESLRELYLGTFSNCLRTAHFGCSTGPNTLQFVSKVIDVIHFTCQNLNLKEPMFQVFLNDLPRNDFNTLFRSLPSFYEKLEKEEGSGFGPCFIVGMPGNFYGRLFPDHFLHFAHSCYSFQWRSRNFRIRRFEIFKVDWDANMDKGNKSLRSGKHSRGNYVAMSRRGVVQSILASHFGEEVRDSLFDRYAISTEEYLEVDKCEYTNMVISPRKK